MVRFRFLFLSLGVPAAFLAGPHSAAEVDHASEYRACMALAVRKPDDAFASALAWRDLGGGDAADHCAATALVGLKLFPEAAQRFEEIAQRIKAEPDFKARLLAHASQAWLLAGKPDRADDVLTAALKLVPGEVDLLVDRATARAALKRYWEALDDLNQAIEGDPSRADAFAFRASAYRFLDSLDLAASDADQALRLNATHPEALLERGIIRRLKGDNDGARQDWLTLVTAHPGTPAARSAQANLEKMDVRTKK
jgi:regulator of sirC expression with transglutaminase-like and TPR domain